MGAEHLERMLRERSRIIAEGDLDAVSAASLLHEALGKPVSVLRPWEHKHTVFENVVSVELPPGKIGGLRRSVLLDHHERVGAYWFTESGLERLLKKPGRPVRSVLEVAEEAAGKEAPEDVREIVGAIDTGTIDLRHPVYVGYQLLSPWEKWRPYAVKSMENLRRVLEWFRKTGETFGEAVWRFEPMVHVLRGEKYAVVSAPRLQIMIPAPTGEPVRTDIGRFLSRAKSIELARKEPLYSVRYQPTRTGVALTISCNPEIFPECDAAEMVRKLAGLFSLEGYPVTNYGGRREVAGIHVDARVPVTVVARMLERALGVEKDVLKELLERVAKLYA